MLRKFLILFVLTSAFFPLVFADEDFEKLCQYDGKFCKRLKNKDGSFIKPKEHLMQVIRTLNEPLLDVTSRMGVDPKAVVAGMLAENTMNVQVDQQTHDFIEKIKLNPTAVELSRLLRGVSFSIGFGQIKPESALVAEPLLAKFENRQARSLSEVKEALLNPVESIKYATAMIKDCQDKYQKNGFDISNRVDLLATVYNLGDCETLATKTKLEKRNPLPNYFGFFAKKYEKEFAEVVKPAKLDMTSSADQSKPVSQEDQGIILAEELKVPVKLYSFPPKCISEGNGEVKKIIGKSSLQLGQIVASVKGAFRKISNGLDCEMKDWVLIESADGKIGWASLAIIEKAKTLVASKRANGCNDEYAKKCYTDLKTKFGDQILNLDSQGQIQVALLSGPKESGPANFKRFSLEECYGPENTYSGFGGDQSVKIDVKEKDRLIQLLVSKRSSLEKSAEGPNSDSLKSYLDVLDQVIQKLKSSCGNDCVGNPLKIEKLAKVDPAELKGLPDQIQFQSEYKFADYVKEETKDSKKIPLKDLTNFAKENCRGIIQATPNFDSRLREIESTKSFQNSRIERVVDVTGIQRSCQILRNHKNKVAKPEGNSFCNECSVLFTNNKGGQMHSFSQPLDSILSLIKSDRDYDEALVGIITGSLSSNQMYDLMSDTSARCTYDPIKSAERVKAILKHPCVQSAFVPDMYLINSINPEGGKLFFRPFLEDDRFSVSLKKSCFGVGATIGEGPGAR